MKIAAGAALLIGLLCLVGSAFSAKLAGGGTIDEDLRAKSVEATQSMHGPQASRITKEERDAKRAVIREAKEAREKAARGKQRLKSMLKIAGIVLSLAGVGGLLWANSQEE